MKSCGRDLRAELRALLSQPSLTEGAMRNLVRRGCLEEAARMLEGEIREHPQSAPAHEALGSIYFEQGKFDQAIAACEEAIRIDPQRELAYRKLAAAWKHNGQVERALDSLTRAIRLHPENPRNYLEAAELLRDQRAFEEALALVNDAIDQQPNHRELRQCRLELYLEAEQFEQASAEAQALLAEQPDNLRVLEVRAAACFYLGRYAEAIAASRRLVALAPSVAHYHLRLGALYQEVGDLGRALEEYEWALAWARDDDVAAAAWDALATLDESQVPYVMILAAESPAFRRRLQQDPVAATRERGFFLSQKALLMLAAIDFEHFPNARHQEIVYY